MDFLQRDASAIAVVTSAAQGPAVGERLTSYDIQGIDEHECIMTFGHDPWEVTEVVPIEGRPGWVKVSAQPSSQSCRGGADLASCHANPGGNLEAIYRVARADTLTLVLPGRLTVEPAGHLPEESQRELDGVTHPRLAPAPMGRGTVSPCVQPSTRQRLPVTQAPGYFGKRCAWIAHVDFRAGLSDRQRGGRVCQQARRRGPAQRSGMRWD